MNSINHALSIYPLKTSEMHQSISGWAKVFHTCSSICCSY